ncbi:MAG: aldo/keto reductase, partial [Actinomycetota bacterium]|nr:aldo/keto reductase [Actinomycetota bacterium]
TDWIDLYQMHATDPQTPIEETLASLQELVAEGKVRYIGSSNFSGWQVVDADWVAHTNGQTAFVSAQNKYSIADRSADDELVPALEHIGVDLLPFFPLEFGLLTGKYRRGEPAPEGSRLAAQTQRLQNADFDLIEALETFAAERSVSILDVAIGWLVSQPYIGSVIAGATSAEQVVANVNAGKWEPTDQDLAALDELTAA